MTYRLYFFLACFSLAMISGAAFSHDTNASRPHIRRSGDNLAENPSMATRRHWHLLGNASYDANVSRSADGSGSVRLMTPYYDDSKHAGIVASRILPVESEKKYTLGFFAKTENGPTLFSAYVGIYDANRKFIRNMPGIRSGTSEDGQWEECAVPMFLPKEAKFIQIKIVKMADTRPGGKVWVDEVYFGEGIGLARPPSEKRAFNGEHVRVDRLGNFEIKSRGRWIPFFPLCIYSDNTRDWSVYSKQGWNTVIWTASADYVQRAKDAVSRFNPDGMMAGFQISQYTFPSGWAYNDLDHLRRELHKIFDRGLGDHLLMYYWDNENNYGEWDVPVAVIHTVKSVDVDSHGKRLHPIYALQGNYGIARVHAARGLVDVSGVYVGGGAHAAGGAGPGDLDGLFVLDRLEGQVSPAAFAQFNGVDGAGDMRLRLYNSIILGAKAIGYWRDCFHEKNVKAFPQVGPVDKKPWWSDFPNLRREVDQLLPIIRQPHWTSWEVRTDSRGKVRVGSRELDGHCYLILVNQTTRRQQFTVTISGLMDRPTAVHDYFSGREVSAVTDGSFCMTLPGIGVGRGTMVLRVLTTGENRGQTK